MQNAEVRKAAGQWLGHRAPSVEIGALNGAA